jgi:hypothetical protein
MMQNPATTSSGRNMLKLAVAIVTLFLSAVSFAQTAAGNLQTPAYKFEITPFIGYRTGGQFEEINGDAEFKLTESEFLGFLFSVAANANGQYEFLYAQQSTKVDSAGLFVSNPRFDLDVEYYQFGGTYL